MGPHFDKLPSGKGCPPRAKSHNANHTMPRIDAPVLGERDRQAVIDALRRLAAIERNEPPAPSGRAVTVGPRTVLVLQQALGPWMQHR